MDRALRIITCLLLVAILAVQILILRRMPPTLNDLCKAKGKDLAKLMLNKPIVRAEVDTPLQVEVDNIPLGVEIWR